MAKVGVRNLCQNHINIDSRISKKTCLLADNSRIFVDRYKPWQGSWSLKNTGVNTSVGVRCSIVIFNFFMLHVVDVLYRVCTTCGFVKFHKFCWIGDNGYVSIFRLSFLSLCAVGVRVVFDCSVAA